jgi:hypothetical protein
MAQAALPLDVLEHEVATWLPLADQARLGRTCRALSARWFSWVRVLRRPAGLHVWPRARLVRRHGSFLQLTALDLGTTDTGALDIRALAALPSLRALRFDSERAFERTLARHMTRLRELDVPNAWRGFYVGRALPPSIEQLTLRVHVWDSMFRDVHAPDLPPPRAVRAHTLIIDKCIMLDTLDIANCYPGLQRLHIRWTRHYRHWIPATLSDATVAMLAARGIVATAGDVSPPPSSWLVEKHYCNICAAPATPVDRIYVKCATHGYCCLYCGMCIDNGHVVDCTAHFVIHL